MTISLNLSNDWKVVNDTFPVTYQSKTGKGAYPSGATYLTSTVANVLQRAITKEDVSKDPALLEGDKGKFHLWAAKLAGVVPKIGDLLTAADGVLRIVRTVEMCDLDGSGSYQRYVCLTQKSPQGS